MRLLKKRIRVQNPDANQRTLFVVLKHFCLIYIIVNFT
jgi:hypothetical protein